MAQGEDTMLRPASTSSEDQSQVTLDPAATNWLCMWPSTQDPLNWDFLQAPGENVAQWGH